MKPRLPVATLAVLAACLTVAVAELAGDGPALCEHWGFVPARFLHADGLAPAITYAVVHDPRDPLHLAGNLAFLAVFGSLVERELGAARMLAVLLSGAVAGALGHLLLAPVETDPLVGGSGGVFALLAVSSVIDRRALPFTVLLFVSNLLALLHPSPWLVPERASVGCHIGGFFAGTICALVVSARRAARLPWRWSSTGSPASPLTR